MLSPSLQAEPRCTVSNLSYRSFWQGGNYTQQWQGHQSASKPAMASRAAAPERSQQHTLRLRVLAPSTAAGNPSTPRACENRGASCASRTPAAPGAQSTANTHSCCQREGEWLVLSTFMHQVGSDSMTRLYSCVLCMVLSKASDFLQHRAEMLPDTLVQPRRKYLPLPSRHQTSAATAAPTPPGSNSRTMQCQPTAWRWRRRGTAFQRQSRPLRYWPQCEQTWSSSQ